MKKPLFSKDKVKRGGIYVIYRDKYAHDPGYELVYIYYDRASRNWYIYNYPYMNCTEHFVNNYAIDPVRWIKIG